MKADDRNEPFQVLDRAFDDLDGWRWLPTSYLTFALLADPEGHVIGLSKGAV